jgi:hypothetical protein
MTHKRGRKGEIWHVCANDRCKRRVEVEETDVESETEA